MALVSAKCTNCGGDIQLDDSKKSGFCLHCGSKVNVEEAIGMVKIDNSDNVEKYLKIARNAEDASNNEECEKYCNMVLEIDSDNIEAWYLKGKAAGWQTTLSNNRLTDMVSCFRSAYDLIDKKDEETLKHYAITMCNDITSISGAVINLTCGNFGKYVSQKNLDEIVNQLSIMLNTIHPLALALSTYLDESYDLEDIFNYAASQGNIAACAGWREVLNDFGTERSEQSKYAWERFINDGDIILDLLSRMFTISHNIKDCKQIVDNYEIINTKLMNSCSYKFDCGQYLPAGYYQDYSLTAAAKKIRQQNINDMKQKLKEKELEEKKKQIEKKREYYKNHKDELEKELKKCEDVIAKNQKKFVEFEEELKKRNATIAQLEDEKSNLGLFKFSAKAELKEKINVELVAIDEINQKREPLVNQVNEAREFIDNFGPKTKKKEKEEDEE